ncbi:hypothetical protein SRB5_39760 [Streptomyces sp. RB5]|uniref:Pyridoxamine 5'-phosphate oxidase N-terminal domain-containing protein n=1 Tax=Streptomyces smaragdinus TaxID=2585196 RepID=A0A7K0CJZ8_9ACTN|nr:pyridoxamine 5'-phosphate oxidase family protein [Streptomyces smaragdinus]MQY13820.1 hypothetical protein [Streptomyces smaragdinus]
MTHHPVRTDLDARYSDKNASATPWEEAADAFARAELYWLSTIRPGGGVHVTPLLAVWRDGTLHFCTGETEQKYRNLAANAEVALTTGTNVLAEGLDLVLNGTAVRVRDESRLRALAADWEAKYGPEWHFDVTDGAFEAGHGPTPVFEVRPVTAYAFAKGPFGHTRYSF